MPEFSFANPATRAAHKQIAKIINRFFMFISLRSLPVFRLPTVPFAVLLGDVEIFLVCLCRYVSLGAKTFQELAGRGAMFVAGMGWMARAPITLAFAGETPALRCDNCLTVRRGGWKLRQLLGI
jgi:hypothetical protein